MPTIDVANPLNPLEWLQTAQDWFARAERSSGFRPYLLFLILASGVGLSLLTFFPSAFGAQLLAILILGTSFGGFIVLFAVKAFVDPDFCRSETHVRRMKKLDLEHMGSETVPLPADVLEKRIAIEAPRLLERGDEQPEAAGGGDR